MVVWRSPNTFDPDKYRAHISSSLELKLQNILKIFLPFVRICHELRYDSATIDGLFTCDIKLLF